MFLLVLALCGVLVFGKYFIFYVMAEITFTLIIWYINSKMKRENLLPAVKYIGELAALRIGSTIIWAVVFSIANMVLTGDKKIYYQWFPPEDLVLFYLFIYPVWRIILWSVACLVLTMLSLHFSICKRKKTFYYFTVLMTTLVIFYILTYMGSPLYFH